MTLRTTTSTVQQPASPLLRLFYPLFFEWFRCSTCSLLVIPQFYPLSSYDSTVLPALFLWFICSTRSLLMINCSTRSLVMVPLFYLLSCYDSIVLPALFLWFNCSTCSLLMIPPFYLPFYYDSTVLPALLWFQRSTRFVVMFPLFSLLILSSPFTCSFIYHFTEIPTNALQNARIIAKDIYTHEDININTKKIHYTYHTWRASGVETWGRGWKSMFIKLFKHTYWNLTHKILMYRPICIIGYGYLNTNIGK